MPLSYAEPQAEGGSHSTQCPGVPSCLWPPRLLGGQPAAVGQPSAPQPPGEAPARQVLEGWGLQDQNQRTGNRGLTQTEGGLLRSDSL